MSNLFSRRFTWVIYEVTDDVKSHVIDCCNGDILSYMKVGYNAEIEFSNTMNGILHLNYYDSENNKRYYADLIESRFADRFIHK